MKERWCEIKEINAATHTLPEFQPIWIHFDEDVFDLTNLLDDDLIIDFSDFLHMGHNIDLPVLLQEDLDKIIGPILEDEKIPEETQEHMDITQEDIDILDGIDIQKLIAIFENIKILEHYDNPEDIDIPKHIAILDKTINPKGIDTPKQKAIKDDIITQDYEEIEDIDIPKLIAILDNIKIPEDPYVPKEKDNTNLNPTAQTAIQSKSPKLPDAAKPKIGFRGILYQGSNGSYTENAKSNKRTFDEAKLARKCRMKAIKEKRGDELARLYISVIEIHSFIKPTIDWLLNQRFLSGNFPSLMGSGSGDRLVQWCHGAPGFIPLCTLQRPSHITFYNNKEIAVKNLRLDTTLSRFHYFLEINKQLHRDLASFLQNVFGGISLLFVETWAY